MNTSLFSEVGIILHYIYNFILILFKLCIYESGIYLI